MVNVYALPLSLSGSLKNYIYVYIYNLVLPEKSASNLNEIEYVSGLKQHVFHLKQNGDEFQLDVPIIICLHL